MKEAPEHIKIFELYYSMGKDRSIKKLWNKLCQDYTEVMPKIPSYPTLKLWSKKFNWQQRVEQRDIENSKALENKLSKEVNKTIVNSKADYRALIKKVVIEFEKRLKDGKIKISKPEDLSIMAKLDMLMMGEATEKGELQVTTNAKQKLIDKINSIATRAREVEVAEQPDGEATKEAAV